MPEKTKVVAGMIAEIVCSYADLQGSRFRMRRLHHQRARLALPNVSLP